MPLIRKFNSSRDSGLTWQVEENELYFRTHFYLSPSIMVHTRNCYNIIDLLSDFGGMSPIILFVFQFLATAINQRLIIAKFIRSIYFIKRPKNEDL
jgi:hypothetical protein